MTLPPDETRLLTQAGPSQRRVADRYLLGEQIGAGGMAEVFRAHDELLGRDVAIKVFGAHIDAHGPDRVRAEMRTLAGLTHRSLVAVYDAGTDSPSGRPEQAYLVMQLVDGQNLAQALGSGPLAPERVREIGVDVADALAYVHQRGVVHRDIKPANILLDGSGRPYLADFGIAQTLGQQALTATGLTLGTAPYLSPEQVAGKPVGPASDVYALGLVLLEGLTGKREYPGTGAETALARLSRSPQIPPHLPAPWAPLLTAMTSTDPMARPSAAAVAVALDGVVAPSPPTALLPPATALLPPVEPMRATEQMRATTGTPPLRVLPGHSPTRAFPSKLLAGAAVLIVLAVVLAVSLSSRGPGTTSPTLSPVAPGSPGPSRLDADLTRLKQLAG
jgi:serine/threonine protein kinase